MLLRQAITTKYHGPTFNRGARIGATCKEKRIFVAYDHSLNLIQNHATACVELADKLGWLNPNIETYRGRWHMGWDHNECGVHVFVPKEG